MSDENLSRFIGIIDKHEDHIGDHESRLDEHGALLKVQAEQIKQLQDNAIKLENVVMSESRETRLTITETNQKLHELINGLMGYRTGQSRMETDLKMARLESLAKIVGILAGSGGILYYIFG